MIDIDKMEQDEAARLIQFVQPLPFERGGHNCRHNAGEPVITPRIREQARYFHDVFKRMDEHIKRVYQASILDTGTATGTTICRHVYDAKGNCVHCGAWTACPNLENDLNKLHDEMHKGAPNCPTCGNPMRRKVVGPAAVSRNVWMCWNCPIDTAPVIEDVEAVEVVEPIKELPPHGDGVH